MQDSSGSAGGLEGYVRPAHVGLCQDLLHVAGAARSGGEPLKLRVSGLLRTVALKLESGGEPLLACSLDGLRLV